MNLPEVGVAGVAASSGGPVESEGARHAALLLHAMAPSDRDWLLEALPEQERSGLRALLQELKKLGMDRDPALIAEATRAAGRAALPRVPASDEDSLHALDGHQLDALIRLMQAEPPRLVADWLRLADWPWRGVLLNGLELGHRQRVEALLAGNAHAPVPRALRGALVAKVAQQLQDRTPIATGLLQELRASARRLLQSAGFLRRALR